MTTHETTAASVARPTSPHLSIYRPQISSVLSIMHRMTGLALVAGSALMALWLWSAAYSPAYYADLHECLSSPSGKIVMIGWTAAFYYHLANGVRHLFWDIGKGFTIVQLNRSGWMVLLFSVGATVWTWWSLLGNTLGGQG